jgi:hypothetical protein
VHADRRADRHGQQRDEVPAELGGDEPEHHPRKGNSEPDGHRVWR